jgi:hypothetical protein
MDPARFLMTTSETLAVVGPACRFLRRSLSLLFAFHRKPASRFRFDCLSLCYSYALLACSALLRSGRCTGLWHIPRSGKLVNPWWGSENVAGKSEATP